MRVHESHRNGHAWPEHGCLDNKRTHDLEIRDGNAWGFRDSERGEWLDELVLEII